MRVTSTRNIIVPSYVSFQVNVQAVLQTFKENAHKAHDLLLDVIPRIAAEDWTEIIQKKQVGENRTNPNMVIVSCFLHVVG